MVKISSGLGGIAGQYFVAAELSRLGYIALLTMRNTKGIDILASKEGPQIAIQVKTTRSDNRRWLLSRKSETLGSYNLFYVFVNLKKEGELPDFTIVPSEVVADYLKASTEKSISTLGRDGKPRRDSGIREFHDKEEKYKDKWELLDCR